MLRAMTLVFALSSFACAHASKPLTPQEAAMAKADKELYEKITRNEVPGWTCKQQRVTGTHMARYVCYSDQWYKELSREFGRVTFMRVN